MKYFHSLEKAGLGPARFSLTPVGLRKLPNQERLSSGHSALYTLLMEKPPG